MVPTMSHPIRVNTILKDIYSEVCTTMTANIFSNFLTGAMPLPAFTRIIAGVISTCGTAWILTKEKWLDDIKWLDLLKLKFSVGQQGNDRIDDFLYVDTYNINNSNNELSLGFSRKGNKNITWETNTNINLGIEFELLKGRLSGSIEYFNRRTTDMLNCFSVPLSLGYSGYYDNIGDMNNKGVEIDLKYIPVKTRNVTWNIGFNATHYRNKISRLAESKKQTL